MARPKGLRRWRVLRSQIRWKTHRLSMTAWRCNGRSSGPGRPTRDQEGVEAGQVRRFRREKVEGAQAAAIADPGCKLRQSRLARGGDKENLQRTRARCGAADGRS